MIDNHEDPIAQQNTQKRGQFLLSRRTLFAASLATLAAAQVSKALGGGARPVTEQINPECGVYAYAYVYALG
ncbi:hypothetical protein C8N35_104126 [Breoghania corrubedonensis]|uniref:Uncharacterized protein n=1 Tax=Breoghania corrubedonensis TaxID=665038 RepID=A0A2T5V9R8_9HYPH|nr:hypothetical protein [Breoghania corrubedonensis]PTW60503.1 hypothetical protein C8N35_104126 [Breoghania corrubedonensis]